MKRMHPPVSGLRGGLVSLAVTALLLAPRLAAAQGCVAVGQTGATMECRHAALGPGEAAASDAQRGMLGPYLMPGEVDMALGYRYFRSFRHYVGATEQTQRADRQDQVINTVNVLDLTVTVGVTERLSVSAGLPYLRATRSGTVKNGSTIIARTVTESQGIGDLRLLGRGWLASPSSHPPGNVALGLGVKLPTGRFGHEDVKYSRSGSDLIGSDQAVDQSIQPGDGGTGIIFDLQAFRTLGWATSLYAGGTYIANPRGTNGVFTGRSRAGEDVMSVADQYVAVLGFARPVWPAAGLSMSIGGRLEGVPPSDFIGPSHGFRRPGFVASIEPGLTLTRGLTALFLSAPVALHRERQQSTTDVQDGIHGDAAFADYSIIAGIGQRF